MFLMKEEKFVTSPNHHSLPRAPEKELAISENLTEIILHQDKVHDVSTIPLRTIIHVEVRNRFPKLIGEGISGEKKSPRC